jgi:hypothetical protein
MKELLHHIASLARLTGMLNEVAYRDKLIKIEFEEMKKDETKQVSDIIRELADKYFLSLERTAHICYETEYPGIEKTIKIKRKIIRRQ